MAYFMKALQMMAVVSSWSMTALADGKVTLKEGAELVEEICKVLGVPCDLTIGS